MRTQLASSVQTRKPATQRQQCKQRRDKQNTTQRKSRKTKSTTATDLVGDLVLVGSEPAPGPDALLLQPGQGLLQHRIAVQRGGGVAVLQAAVVDRHNLVGTRDHLRVDRALDGFL